MKKTIIVIALLSSMYTISANAKDDDHTFEIKVNTRYFGDEGTAHASLVNPTPKQTEYEQIVLTPN